MTGTDHELVAGYALDALDPEDEQRFDAHLAECTICAAELDSLLETAASLALALEDTQPPPSLREQILASVRNELPTRDQFIRPRRSQPRPAIALAAIAVCTTIGLGIWTLGFTGNGGDGRTSRLAEAAIVSIIANSNAKTIRLDGYSGRVVVIPSGRAILAANQFPPLKGGEHYEIWVAAPLAQPRPAGVFWGGRGSLILLTTHVRKGAEVTVTRERGAVTVPTGPIVARTQGAA